jgi:hypothetical protein
MLWCIPLANPEVPKNAGRRHLALGEDLWGLAQLCAITRAARLLSPIKSMSRAVAFELHCSKSL